MAISAHNVTFVDTPQGLKEALPFLRALSIISLDTETTGVNPLVDKVLLISAGNLIHQYVFDVAKIYSYIDPLRQVLSDPTKLFLLHNAKFDYKFLKQHLGIVIENIYDSMVVEMLLLKGRKQQGFGLDDVADKYLSVKMNKDIRKSFIDMKFGDAFTKEQIMYSGIDVQHLELIRKNQLELIKKYGLDTVVDIEMKAIPPTGDMELNGMYLSPTLWRNAELQAIKDRDAAREVLDSLVLPQINTPSDELFPVTATINYNSPKQLLPVLRKVTGASEDELDSTGEAAIKEILAPGLYDKLQKIKEGEQLDFINSIQNPGDKLLIALLVYREKEKRITTYGSEFLEHISPATGRIHSNFSQLFTDTGRYSSSDPNLQNIPRAPQYREAFTAWHPDYRIIGCDYSGMELRILADLSGEPSWIDCFKRNGDLHSENGSALMGKTIRKKGTNGPEDPGENWDLRQPVKSLNFGVGYGMGPQKLSRETGMEYEKARDLIKKFWTTFKHVKNYFDKHVSESFVARCVRSPYDQRLRWLDGFDYDARKDQSRMRNLCMNFPMQSGNASITKHALYLIRQHLKGKDAKIISTVHDEILIECHKDIADEVFKILSDDMVTAGARFIKNVPVAVEGHIDTHWSK